MVEISNISKFYGETRAVVNLSFSLAKGDVLGFLGPNGAGKTTVMRMLTGYIKPDTGRILVQGLDPQRDRVEYRQSIGYLPEKPPLYSELTVGEYLQFVAKLRGLRGKELLLAVGESIELLGLIKEEDRLISVLSKGFKQRVGLAQAILHKPALLILDEPMTGLDPLQRAGLRETIANLAQGRTVLLSSHILTEVDQIANRFLLVDRGQKKIELDREALRLTHASTLLIEIQEGRDLSVALSQISCVERVSSEKTDRGIRYTIRILKKGYSFLQAKNEILNWVARNGIEWISIRDKEISLEEFILSVVEEGT